MLETLISIAGGALGVGSNVASILSYVSSIGTGAKQQRVIELLEQMNGELVKLSDHIHYAPQADPIAVGSPQSKLMDLRELRELLEPVQSAIGKDIISSRILRTPEQLQIQLQQDPWLCLDGVVPLRYAAFDRSADWVPLLFEHGGTHFVGWQKRGMLRSVLGFDFSSSDESWLKRMPLSPPPDTFISGAVTGFQHELDGESVAHRKAQPALGSTGSSQGSHAEHLSQVEQLRKAANTGDASAQYRLGWMYEQGSGLRKDYREALELYLTAARNGLADAQFRAGWMYRHGLGTARDETKAAHWYLQSAQQGNPSAQCNIGVAYQYGRGVKKDEGQACLWYRKAADRGLSLAQFNLGLSYEKGQGVGRDDWKAVNWYLKAADQGDADAQINLGLMFATGRGAVLDLDRAADCFRKAIKQGHPRGQQLLDWLKQNRA